MWQSARNVEVTMSNSVTAQAFREAAAQLVKVSPVLQLERELADLLLAAAEQREQLDATNAQLDLYMAENEALHEQIATLTAERDALKAALRRVSDEVAMLTIQSDGDRDALLLALMERDAARATMAKLLALVQRGEEYAPVNVELAMKILAPTRPA